MMRIYINLYLTENNREDFRFKYFKVIDELWVTRKIWQT